MNQLDNRPARAASGGTIVAPQRFLLMRGAIAVLAVLHLVATLATAHAVIRVTGSWGIDSDTRVGPDIAIGLSAVFLAAAITHWASLAGVAWYRVMRIWMIPAALLLFGLVALAIADSEPVLPAPETGAVV